MCRFKSGIILKTRCVVAPKDNDSHSDLLRELNINDTYVNTSRLFVRAELVPRNDEWWTDPSGWEFNVDQDVLPDWYDDDPGRYEEEFRQAVRAWWDEHVIVDEKIDELSSGFYRLKRCEIKKLLKDVKVYLDQSKVREMWENSQVGEMCGDSQVREMWGNSQVGQMWENSRVGKMCGNSQVREMCGNSQVREMCGDSQVREMCGNSRVGKMCGNSQVGQMWGDSRVGQMRNNSQVGKMWENSQVGQMWENSRVGQMCGDSRVGQMCGDSRVGQMWGNSIARDYKRYPNITIRVPKGSQFELIEHEEEQ